MQIGIVGARRMGSMLGKAWAEKGHTICFGSRDPHRAKQMAASIGGHVNGGSIAEAAAFGEIILLAIPWVGVADALQAAGSLDNKVLIDCTLPLVDRQLAVAADSSGAQEIAKLVPAARVVKAFSTIYYEHLVRPTIAGETISLFYCGDDPAAKANVAQLGAEIGFDPVDAGPLFIARFLEGMGITWSIMSVVSGYGNEIGFKLLRAKPKS